MKYSISVCGSTFQITSCYDSVAFIDKQYLSNDCAEYSIVMSEDDTEKEKSIQINELHFLPAYSDGYFEFLAVYRKIIERLSFSQTILFHGSAISVDNCGYCFTAKSGTGKSTHTRLWRELFGTRAVMINDDKPLITCKNETIYAWGTPWDGKHHLSSNICVPLKSICILERGTDNYISEISKKDAYPLLLQQTYRPENPVGLTNTLETLDRVISGVSLYKLRCNMEIDAARVSYEKMK